MASIKHISRPIPVSLPDFRNLGVCLRILVISVGAAVVVGVARAAQWAQALEQLWQISAATLPPLLTSLLVLYAVNGRLQRLPYRIGVLAVLLLGLIVTLATSPGFTMKPTPNALQDLGRAGFFSLVLSGLLLAYFKLRSRALSPAIAEARLQALQARIRPHFLFNSINAVLSLIRSEPQRAEIALEDLADLFRVLMADNRELVPLQSELALCRQYLALEKLRLGERLRLDWHIDHMPSDALIPPLVLQPLLENAVYHGIEPFQDGGDIVINLYRSRDQVHLVLSNPYRKEGDHHSGNKMALSNIRERLALHFDAEAQLMTKVAENRYQVHIVIPYRRIPA